MILTSSLKFKTNLSDRSKFLSRVNVSKFSTEVRLTVFSFSTTEECWDWEPLPYLYSPYYYLRSRLIIDILCTCRLSLLILNLLRVLLSYTVLGLYTPHLLSDHSVFWSSVYISSIVLPKDRHEDTK